MGLFSTTQFDSLDDLFFHQLKDLYDAELRLMDALPKMIEKASNMDLKAALEDHLLETEKQIERLEMIFGKFEQKPERVRCDAMIGLISEGRDVLDAEGDPDVLDAALIAAAQRVEHYEISGYGTARAFARQLGYAYPVELLQQTLDEEAAADKKLTSIAERSVNEAAV